jgi:RNA polymerase sigma-70 factor (ECF subfamily)
MIALSSPLSAASDSLLVRRAEDGDQQAFAMLVRRHGPFLRAFAMRLTGSSADADDALQDALIVAWEQLPTLENPEKVRSWLISIVSRKATDRLRRRKPSSQLDPERDVELRPGPESSAVSASRLEALNAVLGRLPEAQRQCWILKEVAGLSYEEIAERLELTATVVRGKLARARATVVKEMEEWR